MANYGIMRTEKRNETHKNDKMKDKATEKAAFLVFPT